MKPSPKSQAWNRIMAATIGASIAEDKRHQPATESWWLAVPLERWTDTINVQVPRMVRSKMARTMSVQILEWPI